MLQEGRSPVLDEGGFLKMVAKSRRSLKSNSPLLYSPLLPHAQADQLPVVECLRMSFAFFNFHFPSIIALGRHEGVGLRDGRGQSTSSLRGALPHPTPSTHNTWARLGLMHPGGGY